MFKLYYILKNNQSAIANLDKNKLTSRKLSQLINTFKFNKFISLKNKYNKKQFNSVWVYKNINRLIFQHKNDFFKRKLAVLSLFCFRVRDRFKYKIRYLLCFFSLVFLENTIPIKTFFCYFLKYKSLKRHKKFMLKLMLFFKKLINALHTKQIQTKISIRFKGRLGIKGNKKRVKYNFKFNPLNKYGSVKK